MSAKREGSWLEQWGRMERWYSKLREIENGELSEKDFSSEMDVLYCFFLNCYHLKDWLIESGAEKESVDNYINGSLELKLCADIANVSKHLTLRKHRSGDNRLADFTGYGVNISIGREYLPPQSRKSKQRDYHLIVTAGKIWDALDLASTCMLHWDKFIKMLIKQGKIASHR